METETGGRNVYAKIVRGTIAREEGNLDEALRWFTQAMQLCPSSLELHTPITFIIPYFSLDLQWKLVVFISLLVDISKLLFY